MNVKEKLRNYLRRFPIIGDYIKCSLAGISFVSPITFFKVSVLKRAKHYYPAVKNCILQHPRQLVIGKNSIVLREGGYIQAEGGIFIGNYVRIANFCTLMSTNHDIFDHRKKHAKPIIIHDYCWIGTRSIILAGVELGPKTVVGAGAVVTKSFPDGYCVIAGNPAKIIKTIEKEKVILPHSEYEYYGCLSSDQFKKYYKKFIDYDLEIS